MIKKFIFCTAVITVLSMPVLMYYSLVKFIDSSQGDIVNPIAGALLKKSGMDMTLLGIDRQHRDVEQSAPAQIDTKVQKHSLVLVFEKLKDQEGILGPISYDHAGIHILPKYAFPHDDHVIVSYDTNDGQIGNPKFKRIYLPVGVLCIAWLFICAWLNKQNSNLNSASLGSSQ